MSCGVSPRGPIRERASLRLRKLYEHVGLYPATHRRGIPEQVNEDRILDNFARHDDGEGVVETVVTRQVHFLAGG